MAERQETAAKFPDHPPLVSVSVVGMAGKDGVGAVELLEGDNEGEFVLKGEGAEGPEEVGGVEQ